MFSITYYYYYDYYGQSLMILCEKLCPLIEVLNRLLYIEFKSIRSGGVVIYSKK